MDQNSEQIVIGHNTFRKQVTLAELTEQLTPAVKQLIESTSWNLYSRYHQWRGIIRLLQATKLHGLHLSGNQEPLILKQVSHIDFSCLRQFYLWTNYIRSVEPVLRLNAPILTEMHLENNHITVVSSFRKAMFKQLAVLKLKTNKIMSFAGMHGMKHSKDKVNLELYDWGHSLTCSDGSVLLRVNLLSESQENKLNAMINI